MKILKSNVFIGFACFLLGIAAVLAAQRFVAQHHKVLSLAEQDPPFKSGASPNLNSLLDQFYNDDFFNRTHDPFEQMRQMRDQFMKNFDEPGLGSGMFDSWYRNRFGGGDAGEIKRREDKGFVYYDISIKGLDKRNFNFKIADGQISISGQVEIKSEENGNGSYLNSKFHRSFPVPPDVDAKRVQIEQGKDLVTLKFPKNTTS